MPANGEPIDPCPCPSPRLGAGCRLHRFSGALIGSDFARLKLRGNNSACGEWRGFRGSARKSLEEGLKLRKRLDRCRSTSTARGASPHHDVPIRLAVRQARGLVQSSAAARRPPELGVHVLRNQSRTVAGLQLVGIDDPWNPTVRPEVIVPLKAWHN